jgi:glutaminyl-peptide cyclotransferase
VERKLAAIVGLGAALLLAAVVAVVALAGGGDDESDPKPDAARTAALEIDRFDSARAFAELKREVEIGPRTAGSPALRKLARRLRRELPHGRFEPVPEHPGLRNVVGRLPGAKPPIVIAAHYDSKDIPNFVGANDGAAGTAAVMELARVLRRTDRPKRAAALRFVLFDGEEATDDSRPFLETGVRGSKAYAKAHRGEVRSLILLDFVAAKGMRIQREASSDPSLWSKLRHAASRVGAASAFPPGTGSAITDDHTPFLVQGVRAIDLIQWPYDCWHQPCDDLSAVSEASLDRTGETVLELVRTLSRP